MNRKKIKFLFILTSLYTLFSHQIFFRDEVPLGAVFCLGKENTGITISGEMKIRVSRVPERNNCCEGFALDCYRQSLMLGKGTQMVEINMETFIQNQTLGSLIVNSTSSLKWRFLFLFCQALYDFHMQCKRGQQSLCSLIRFGICPIQAPLSTMSRTVKKAWLGKPSL